MRVVKTTVAAMAASVLCFAATARADAETVVAANVPFPFAVNGHTLPAGKYLVQRDDLSSTSVLVIRGANKANRATALFITRPDGGQDPAGFRPALTFKRRENQYELSGIWQSHDDGFDVISR